MSQTATEVGRANLRFDYMPVGLFGSVMGLSGVSVAWRLAQARYGGPAWLGLAWLGLVAPTIGILAVAAFVAMLTGYTVKLLTAFDAVVAEFCHPIAGNLFGTALISLLLLPILLAPHNLMLAQGLWIAGATGLFFAVPLFTLIFSRLLFVPPLPDALKPALLILVVPFAVGYTACTLTTGQNDVFAQALYMLTLFVLAVLLG